MIRPRQVAEIMLPIAAVLATLWILNPELWLVDEAARMIPSADSRVFDFRNEPFETVLQSVLRELEEPVDIVVCRDLLDAPVTLRSSDFRQPVWVVLKGLALQLDCPYSTGWPPRVVFRPRYGCQKLDGGYVVLKAESR